MILANIKRNLNDINQVMDIDKADEFNFLKKVVEEDVQNKNSDGW